MSNKNHSTNEDRFTQQDQRTYSSWATLIIIAIVVIVLGAVYFVSFGSRIVRSPQGQDQILRLGLALLNHKPRIAPTTTTYKIVSFICALQLHK